MRQLSPAGPLELQEEAKGHTLWESTLQPTLAVESELIPGIWNQLQCNSDELEGGILAR